MNFGDGCFQWFYEYSYVAYVYLLYQDRIHLEEGFELRNPSKYVNVDFVLTKRLEISSLARMVFWALQKSRV